MLCSKFSSSFHIRITCCNPSSNMNIYIEEALKFQLLICDGPIKISHWEDKKFELEKPPLQKWKVQNWKQGEMSKSLLLLTDWSLQNALLFFKILISHFGKNKKKTLQGMMMRCGDGRNYGRNYDRFKNICGFWWEMLNTLYRVWVCWCIVLQGTVIVIHGFFFSPPCNYVM